MPHPIRIDLISDTATRPSPAMLERMLKASSGDEQLGEDPTTRMLEERTADLLGHEQALFLPSGTMCNQIALLLHCRPGDEIIAAQVGHVFGSEGAGAAALAGAFIQPIPSRQGIFTAEQTVRAIRSSRPRAPRSRVVVIEQTSNRGGGAVWPLATIQAVANEARPRGLAIHMDGARLLNAVVATGISARQYGECCDSVWIDFSKGLGCPFGAVLAGSRDFIAEAWRWKHRLGGAMRQSGIMAAACLYALDHNIDRLAEDHENARKLAALVRDIPGVKSAFEEIETNMVFLDLADAEISAIVVLEMLKTRGVRMSLENPTLLRAVTHLDVGPTEIELAAEALSLALEQLRRHDWSQQPPTEKASNRDLRASMEESFDNFDLLRGDSLRG